MAQRESTLLRQALSRMFPKAALRRRARATGLVQRLRRVDPVALFWVLVLGASSGRHRSLADLRRSYEKTTGVHLSTSSFYDRFTASLADFCKSLMQDAFEQVSRSSAQACASWSGLREVLCIDSTVVRLHEALAKRFPACRTNHTLAAAKLHTVLNVRGQGPQRVRLSAERVHDSPVLQAGEWVRGRLLLFDLGYFRYTLFDAISRHGGFFLTRLKENANPRILREHRRVRGQAIVTEGQPLQEIKHRLQRAVFDAEAEIQFRRRRYRGRQSRGTLQVRIVALWDDVHQTYHWYVTNLPPEELPAEDVTKLYSARWAIELLFRELKTSHCLEAMPSRKSAIVETLLYTAVISLLASRALLRAVSRWAGIDAATIPLERWARLFVSVAPELLTVVLDPPTMARWRERQLLPFLAREAPDTHRKRPTLLQASGLLACP